MNLCLADYLILSTTLVTLILGLFGGFSGALGFCAGVVAAFLAGRFGYVLLAAHIASKGGAILATLVGVLLAFGLARALVKRIVKGLLAQPADAIFGALIAALTGTALAFATIYFLTSGLFGDVTIESRLWELTVAYL